MSNSGHKIYLFPPTPQILPLLSASSPVWFINPFGNQKLGDSVSFRPFIRLLHKDLPGSHLLEIAPINPHTVTLPFSHMATRKLSSERFENKVPPLQETVSCP